MAHEDLTVTRWRKYGKDRLYVTATDGAKLGWWDLVTGECHPESSEHLATVAAACADWCATNAVPPAAQTNEPAITPDSTSPTPILPEPLPASTTEAPAPAVTEPPVSTAKPPTGTSANNPEQPAETHEPEWTDLSTIRAGAAAREQALALKQAAPVRTFLARVFDVKNDERAWRIGADGEEMVAAQLNKLLKTDPRWRFLHAVPVGHNGSDIDHVAIGPTGVYTLNAKHHPNANIWVGGGTFLVNGQKQPYIRNSRFEATRAAKLLTQASGIPVTVTGIIVPVNARDITIKKAPDEGVVVVNRMGLAKWFEKQPIRLTTEQIDTIYEAARRSTTWHTR